MENVRAILLSFVAAMFLGEGFILYKKQETAQSFEKPKIVNVFEISEPKQFYKNYQEICDQLRKWHYEAGNLTEYATYGKTSHGTECNFLRLGTKDKPKVLIHSGLEGDEEFSVLANMRLIHHFLTSYNKDKEITWLLKNREIYFVPVASPDTFLLSSHIDGFDPVKSFPSPQKPNIQSPAPVKALMDFACEMKFQAVLNFHTFGESFCAPEICNSKDCEKICALIDKMAGSNGYKTNTVQNKAGSGSDVDWFYSNGAVSVKMLWGKTSKQYVAYCEVEPAINRNLSSILTFVKEAPEIAINPRPLRTIYYYQAD
jgi:hypothetical protein